MTKTLTAIGRKLLGRYVIERELGRGGMAAVYVAKDEQTGQDVAVKILDADLAAALGPARFLREISVTRTLIHPNILGVLDSGEQDGSLFYVMPLVVGESLEDKLRREKQLPIEEALAITYQVADALEFAHASSLVHRDIKPANILLAGPHEAAHHRSGSRLDNSREGRVAVV